MAPRVAAGARLVEAIELMRADPIVSVVMAVRDGEPYLRAAIESVLRQTFADFELIILDDGSSDGSIETVRSFGDDRIRLVANEHRGFVASLNDGLQRARAPLVARMDADDLCEPERFEEQVRRLHADPGLMVVGCATRLIDERGRPLGITMGGEEADGEIRPTLPLRSPFAHGSTMFRREMALRVGAYRPAFRTAEDYDLWLRLAEMGALGNVPAPLYRLRQHTASKTAREGGSAVDAYRALALHLAFERLMSGRDALGHRLRSESQGFLPARLDARERSAILANWSLAMLWSDQHGPARALAHMAIRARPANAGAWDMLRRCYVNRAVARQILGDGSQRIESRPWTRPYTAR